MQLVQDTMRKLRKVVRACRDMGVHETAVIMALSEEHEWPEVAEAMPLHLIGCDRYTEHQRVLLTLPDKAVPYLRASVATSSITRPMLFPSDTGRIQYHTERQCRAVNRAEISRKCGLYVRRMLEVSGVDTLDIPFFSGFNRTILSQVFSNTMLCAPAVHGFLVHVTAKEYGQIMQRFSAFKSFCATVAEKPAARDFGQRLVGLKGKDEECRIVLSKAVRDLGFLTK